MAGRWSRQHDANLAHDGPHVNEHGAVRGQVPEIHHSFIGHRELIVDPLLAGAGLDGVCDPFHLAGGKGGGGASERDREQQQHHGEAATTHQQPPAEDHDPDGPEDDGEAQEGVAQQTKHDDTGGSEIADEQHQPRAEPGTPHAFERLGLGRLRGVEIHHGELGIGPGGGLLLVGERIGGGCRPPAGLPPAAVQHQGEQRQQQHGGQGGQHLGDRGHHQGGAQGDDGPLGPETPAGEHGKQPVDEGLASGARGQQDSPGICDHPHPAQRGGQDEEDAYQQRVDAETRTDGPAEPGSETVCRAVQMGELRVQRPQIHQFVHVLQSYP